MLSNPCKPFVLPEIRTHLPSWWPASTATSSLWCPARSFGFLPAPCFLLPAPCSLPLVHKAYAQEQGIVEVHFAAVAGELDFAIEHVADFQAVRQPADDLSL